MRSFRPGRFAFALTAALVTLGLSGLAETREPRIRPTQRPFLWMIEGDTPSFLYGTIHVPDPRVTTLPTVVEKAIEVSDALFTEVPMDAGMQAGLAAKVMLPEGQGLSTRVPAELVQRLDAYARKKGLGGAAMFERIKVWCTALQLQQLGMRSERAVGGQTGGKALDQTLYDRARAAGKEVGGLETIEEQLGCFDVLTDEEQARMLAQTLDLLEAPRERRDEAASPFEDLIKRYVKGDLDEMVESLLAQTGGADPAMVERLKEALLNQRNHRMAERIAAKLRAQPDRSFFFAVGAAHYHGDEGVGELLEAEGFKVRRLTSSDARRLRPRASTSGAR